jgi:hypothetical protein
MKPRDFLFVTFGDPIYSHEAMAESTGVLFFIFIRRFLW